jgi:hypothetical protein
VNYPIRSIKLNVIPVRLGLDGLKSTSHVPKKAQIGLILFLLYRFAIGDVTRNKSIVSWYYRGYSVTFSASSMSYESLCINDLHTLKIGELSQPHGVFTPPLCFVTCDNSKLLEKDHRGIIQF